MVKTPTTPCPPFPCPPTPPPPCPAVCPPPPPPPSCRAKPIMRGLHWTQSMKRLREALMASSLAGLAVFFLYTKPRENRYKEFYALAELDDWADEMAKKGLFQSVPRESQEDNKTKK